MNYKTKIIILSGIPGSGKTTIAKELEKLGYKHFYIDKFYKRLSKETDLEWGPEFEIEGYKLFKKDLGEEITSGDNLIIETSGASDLWLEIFEKLKANKELKLIDILLELKLEEAVRRIDRRNKTDHPHKVPTEKLEGWIKRIYEVRNDYQHKIDASKSVDEINNQIRKII